MRYVKQFAIIILISFVGELLKEFLPFLVPASIYGLILMLIALTTGLIKLEHVKDAGTFLLDAMPVMFLPATVGLMESWGILKSILIPSIIACIFGTIIVMAVSGKVTQFIISILNKRRKENE